MGKRRTSKQLEAITIILAGGEGTRLQPLTSTRCKPAIIFGGRYRIIDITISNAIHSGFKDIFVISQFLATTLNNYLLETYPADALQGGHLEVLSPEETPDRKVWYEGTADAVRKNLTHLLDYPAEYFIILSGDQIYSMDIAEMLDFAKKNQADLTIATLPVNEEEARRMGVMKIDSNFNIVDFFEKPQTQDILMQFAIAPHIAAKHKALRDLSFLGSMGIYIFKRQALIDLLSEDTREDFGKHLIPTQLKKGKTFAYIFDGYWEDIGTIHSYYNATLKLTENEECLDLYNEKRPILTQLFPLPSPRITCNKISQAIIGDGSIIQAKEISHSAIGLRTSISEGSEIVDTVIIGWSPHSMRAPIQIGKNCRIHKAILDEGVSIGDNVHLINEKNVQEYQDDNIVVRDGIIVVKADKSLPNNYRF